MDHLLQLIPDQKSFCKQSIIIIKDAYSDEQKCCCMEDLVVAESSVKFRCSEWKKKDTDQAR